MVTDPLANRLSVGILDQEDPALVRDGAPAYMLMLDGFIQQDGDNTALLTTGARLFSAYASLFVEEPERARRMSTKALGYARRALCLEMASMCDLETAPFDRFEVLLARADREAAPLLYTYGTVWAGWIQAHSGDWTAVADLPKVEALLRRVAALDESYEQGQTHVYLGVLNSLRPPALGGRPEVGKLHFERAIALSDGRNLMAKTEFAGRYARLVFDRSLHDRLLKEVLAADARVPGLTLSNVLAQKKARQLLDTSEHYFE